MLIGLIWLMVFQLAAIGSQAPTALNWMAQLGPWNYAIAFAFMITGLLLTMRWH
ncbi:septation inhibitor protein [Mycobacterium tuberculosis GM 1503]|nr:septation inhibitor protein [Mycobacterium tuberculosis GM 1503]